MTKSKNTKRALLASVLSVAVSAAMLIGSTFAWFTDSVTSGKNKIVAGNLKADLIHVGGGETGADVSIKEKPGHLIFDYDKWEPNYTVMETLKVVNNGNLAFKFRLDAVAVGATVGPKGEKLADVIEVWVYEGEKIPTTKSFAEMTGDPNWRNAGSLSKLMADPDGIARGVLLPNDAIPKHDETVGFVQMTVALHMQETAGNEYQGLSLGDLNLILNAAQYTFEDDSFDDQYDKDADYAYTVKTTDELLSAMASANTGEKILVTGGEYTIPEKADIDTDATVVVGADETVTLDLNENTIAGNHSETYNHPTLQNFGDLVIKNGTIVNNDTDTGFGNAAITQAGGNLKLENCKIANKAGVSGSYCVGVIGGTAEIKDCTISGDRGGLSVEDDASVTVTNCNISAAYYYPLYIYGNGTSTFSETTFTKVPKLPTQSGNGGNYMIYNDFGPKAYGDKGSAAFTNCKFISTRDGGSVFEIRTDKLDSAFTSLSFEGCSYKNVTNVPDGLVEIK